MQEPPGIDEELLEDGQEEVFSHTAVDLGLVKDPRALDPIDLGGSPPDTECNLLLASLAAADAELLRPHLKRVVLPRDGVVAYEGRPIENAIFPCGCLLSVTAVLSGRRVETSTIGVEGALGLLHALGPVPSLERVTVQVAGPALAMPMTALSTAALERPTLMQSMAVFAQAAAAQAALNVACNALHEARQRLCRWLLMSADRIGSRALPLTQEHLAIMLGVQRTTVTALASELQARRIIRYSRGQITILDRDALQAGSCECYELGHHQMQTIVAAGQNLAAHGAVASSRLPS
jgi:CRP-like cAMP-binding protein